MNSWTILLLFWCYCAAVSSSSSSPEHDEQFPNVFLRSSNRRLDAAAQKYNEAACFQGLGAFECRWISPPQLPFETHMQDRLNMSHYRKNIPAFYWAPRQFTNLGRRLASAQSNALLHRGRLLVVCAMHAREPVSTEVCFDWIEQLLNVTEQQPLMPTWEVLIVPIANPDGRDKVVQALRQYQLTRDRHIRDLSWRGNSGRVDLNRNWPPRKTNQSTEEETRPRSMVEWARRATENAQNQTLREDYPGAHPVSEPETYILKKYIDRFSPHVLLSVHSGVNAILVSPDDSFTDEPEPDQMKLANFFAWKTGCNRECLQHHAVTEDQQVRFSNLLGSASCCVVGPAATALRYIANGTMTAYAHQVAGVQFPMTLEVYRDDRLMAEETERARRGTPIPQCHSVSAIRCFSFFNPIREWTLRATLERWRPLFRSLVLELNDADQEWLQARIHKGTEPFEWPPKRW